MTIHIKSKQEFEAIAHKGKEFLLIKHSMTCPISAKAFDQFIQFSKDYPEIKAYYLHVQTERPLSTYIADTYQITHQSPQALYFKNNRVIWNASHWEITYHSLTQNLLKR